MAITRATSTLGQLGVPGPADQVDTGLVDYLERPIRRTPSKAALEQAVATASLTSIRQAWSTEAVAAGLTPERLGVIMRAAAEGDHYRFVILAEEMEERDWHYAAVLAQRKLTVLGLDRIVTPASGSAIDKEIADAVRQDIVEDEAFEDLLAGALDALGKGWSAVEIGWDTSGAVWKPSTYSWRDPRWFKWDVDTGRQLRLLDETDMAFGIELPPFRFALHTPQLKMGLPVRGGLARLAAWAFLFKFYTVKDWAAFSETYGQPLRVGKYDPAATFDDIEVLYRAVAMIGTDCGAVIPKAMDLEFMNASSGSSQSGADLYQKFGDFLDKQVSKAVLGQTGTTDMQHGGGLAQAKVLNGVREDLATSDGKQLSRTVRRDVIEPYVRFRWGQDAKIPGFAIQTTPEEDLERFAAGITPFIDRGLRVPTAGIYGKFNITPPKADEEVLGKPAAAPDPEEDDPPLPGPDSRASNRARNRAQTSPGGVANTDAIDDLADPLNDGWREDMEALIEPIQHLADRATSYAEFQADLAEAAKVMDPTKLAASLGAALFKARGLGDASDKPGG
jgi:phage gp29-like protein